MRRCVIQCGALLVAVITACDPWFGTQYRQALAPTPRLDCIATALRTSAVVDKVTPLRRGDYGTGKDVGFWIALRDTAGLGIPRATVTLASAPEVAGHVTVTYVYMGYDQISLAQRQYWAALAHQLLGTIRSACAPNSPQAVECHGTGAIGGQRGACRGAA